jgi:hypothetical protein
MLQDRRHDVECQESICLRCRLRYSVDAGNEILVKSSGIVV